MTNEILHGKPMLLRLPCSQDSDDYMKISPTGDEVVVTTYFNSCEEVEMYLSEENIIALRDFLTKIIEDK